MTHTQNHLETMIEYSDCKIMQAFFKNDEPFIYVRYLPNKQAFEICEASSQDKEYFFDAASTSRYIDVLMK